MGLIVSVITVVAGAILAVAVRRTAAGTDLVGIGLMLILLGLAGALLSILFWSSWGGFGRRHPRRR
jgi:hypothetical protein